MSRCTKTRHLEVHHIRTDGGNGIENARVLCQDCHENTGSYGSSGHNSPPAFSAETKAKALKNANNQCECTKKDCHS
jgi:5-methylcytosine-specific restriction endonuclease McrA